MTTKELEEKARGRLNKHNNTVMCGIYCYYAHKIMSEQYPKEYLRIIHDKNGQNKDFNPNITCQIKICCRNKPGFVVFRCAKTWA